MVEKILCVRAVLGQLDRVPSALFEHHIFFEPPLRAMFATAIQCLESSNLLAVEEEDIEMFGGTAVSLKVVVMQGLMRKSAVKLFRHETWVEIFVEEIVKRIYDSIKLLKNLELPYLSHVWRLIVPALAALMDATNPFHRCVQEQPATQAYLWVLAGAYRERH